MVALRHFKVVLVVQAGDAEHRTRSLRDSWRVVKHLGLLPQPNQIDQVSQLFLALFQVSALSGMRLAGHIVFIRNHGIFQPRRSCDFRPVNAAHDVALLHVLMRQLIHQKVRQLNGLVESFLGSLVLLKLRLESRLIFVRLALGDASAQGTHIPGCVHIVEFQKGVFNRSCWPDASRLFPIRSLVETGDRRSHCGNFGGLF